MNGGFKGRVFAGDQVVPQLTLLRVPAKVVQGYDLRACTISITELNQLHNFVTSEITIIIAFLDSLVILHHNYFVLGYLKAFFTTRYQYYI